MSIWKDPSPARSNPATPEPARIEPTKPELAAAPAATASRVEADRARKESLIASDITIEGKIEGSGSVRIAGKFKGDVNVQGDLTIEPGAKLTGGVRADKVTIAGELEGNLESASRVDLQPSGAITGDVKAGAFTVAAGARMRGQAVFGWDDDKGGKPGKGGMESGGHA